MYPGYKASNQKLFIQTSNSYDNLNRLNFWRKRKKGKRGKREKRKKGKRKKEKEEKGKREKGKREKMEKKESSEGLFNSSESRIFVILRTFRVIKLYNKSIKI